MAIETRLFINNDFVPSINNQTFSIYNPATDELISDSVHAAGREDIDKAVEAAAAAFPSWKATPSGERAAIMLRFADLCEQHTNDYTSLDTLCMGVPASFGPRMGAIIPIQFRYYAGLVDKIHGEVFTEDGDGMMKMITQEPLGVCAGISAWNGTPLSFAWKIAPAVAAGNTFVHKSSEKSPLSCLALGRLIKEAGFPPGVINLVSGAGETGSFMAAHMGIKKIAFTGSAGAGRKVQQAATESNFKHVTLELGGKSAAIVCDDARLENAIEQSSFNFLLNNAQGCSAASRILVHESIAAVFTEGVKKRFADLASKVGDPRAEATVLGPMADKAQRDRVADFIDGAKSEGIRVLAGGHNKSGPGQFLAPVLFSDPPVDSRIWQEEIFGPVGMIRTFKTDEEALELANDTPYGLSGVIFTSNLGRALRLASKLEVGTLSINGAHFPSKQTSWGGWKQSGHGREGGLEGLKEYLQQKAIHIFLNV